MVLPEENSNITSKFRLKECHTSMKAGEEIFSRFDQFTDNRYLAWGITSLFFIAGLVLIYTANGTCDDGDSIMHYQFARWAPVHHQLFFDHWAKPLYVLLACPFAQMGLPGIKVFNLLISALTILLTFYIAEYFNIKRKSLTVLFMAATPGLMIHALSGLTEPLFALVLVTSVLLYLRNYIWQAIVIISFLPFVRSEGLLICGVFGLMLLIEKRLILLPLLLLGHLVYGVAGYPIYHNLLWVFTRIPYAHPNGVYGSGNWSHFFIHFPEIIGGPLYALLIIGLVGGAIKITAHREWENGGRRWVLICGSFLSYFLGHVIFWKFGIFNSLGLLRVLIGVLPMIVLIELEGLNALLLLPMPGMAKQLIAYILIGTVTVFPLMNFDNSWNYKRDFCLSTSQLADKQATDYVKNNFAGYRQAQYYYDANYVSILLGIDFFDTTISRRVWEIYQHPPRDTGFIIWDNYYSAFECQTPMSVPATNPQFELVKKFTLYDPWNFEKTTVLFKSKPN
jgi:hypothetical protein